jgi:hypothetical protein
LAKNAFGYVPHLTDGAVDLRAGAGQAAGDLTALDRRRACLTSIGAVAVLHEVVAADLIGAALEGDVGTLRRAAVGAGESRYDGQEQNHKECDSKDLWRHAWIYKREEVIGSTGRFSI